MATSNRWTISRSTRSRSIASTRQQEKSSGSVGALRCAKGEAAYEVDAGELNSCDRRQTRGRRLRIDRSPRRVDTAGKELWRADTGILDSGWFFDPTWGHSELTGHLQELRDRPGGPAERVVSPPGIWRPASSSGKLTARTKSRPGAHRRSSLEYCDEIVTNGTKIRGYDPATGKVLWTLGPNSEVTVGTPVAENGLIYVTEDIHP